ncbi:alpha/beta fold hydrolase [Paraburkholderia sp. HP33-1]|uniref:alpha/beta fold hydrolase n=1 Tax=Paraburkholderia sp. HP33-1 TaxID=2883243 RepID=UPI001F2F5277|nr:alpha/beta hydrolase [Paraburkholderia sp. HP33-1]
MSNATPIPVGHYVTVRGNLKLHLHELGSVRDDRPSLMFLHGSGVGASGYSNFKLNIDYFARQGWHVLVPDYLGYGLSDKPRDLAYTSTLHVEVLNDLLIQKEVRSVIPVGNSLGGAIAFEFALTHPDKVDRLVVMGPGGVEDPALWAADMPGLKALGGMVAQRLTDRDSMRKVLHLIVADPATITEEAIDERLPVWIEQPPEVFSTMRVGVYADRLHELKMPVLCFWGAKDQFLPVRHALVVAQRVPNARVVISTDAGHWFMLEQPGYFNREIDDFLSHA